MRKELEFERRIQLPKIRSIRREVTMLRNKVDKLTKFVENYPDIYPTKKELGIMKQFLKDLKTGKSFTPLEELKRK